MRKIILFVFALTSLFSIFSAVSIKSTYAVGFFVSPSTGDTTTTYTVDASGLGAFTLYTVRFVDLNGNPIPNLESLQIAPGGDGKIHHAFALSATGLITAQLIDGGGNILATSMFTVNPSSALIPCGGACPANSVGRCVNSEPCVKQSNGEWRCTCPPPNQTCTLTSAAWGTTRTNVGDTVRLVVYGDANCEGKEVSFQVLREGYCLFGTCTHTTNNPVPVSFVIGQTITSSTWVAEYNDWLGGNNQWHFVARLTNSGQQITSSDPKLVVDPKIPRITVLPSSGNISTEFTLRGSDLIPDYSYNVSFVGQNGPITNRSDTLPSTNALGELTYPFVINAPAGTVTANLIDRAQWKTVATTTFTIENTPAAPISCCGTCDSSRGPEQCVNNSPCQWLYGRFQCVCSNTDCASVTPGFPTPTPTGGGTNPLPTSPWTGPTAKPTYPPLTSAPMPIFKLNCPPNVPCNTTVSSVANFILQLVVTVGIIAAMAFLIFGGIKYITSAGNKQSVETARSHIVMAIIGLIIIVLAWVILNVVLNILGLPSFTNVFNIPNFSGN